MIYVWHCENCDVATEVSRPVAQIDVKPDNGCTCCGQSEQLRRSIESANFRLKGPGWFKTHGQYFTKDKDYSSTNSYGISDD